MPPDALTLAFDTSAAHCAAALLLGGTVLAERRNEMRKGQAERLFGLLEELLTEAGVVWRDLSCIGVGIGPGNFTGIRISVSAARGLALSLDKPAIGVSTLEAQAEGTQGVVVSVLDALRDNYYVHILGQNEQLPPVYCDAMNMPDIASHTKPSVVGFDADAVAAHYSGRVVRPAYPQAVAIGRLAARRIHSKLSRPAPLYLRNADAAPPRDVAPVILP